MSEGANLVFARNQHKRSRAITKKGDHKDRPYQKKRAL